MRTVDIVKAKFSSIVPSPDKKNEIENNGDNPRMDLERHLSLCQEILAIVETENQTLRSSDQTDVQSLTPKKQEMLQRLQHSIEQLRKQRILWQQMPASEKAKNPEIKKLLKQNQELIMKIVMLDRENEQLLLRKGMVPAHHLPPAQRQQPHFVTELYRRQGHKVL
jgi:flagellar biosynthesis/type III secretory pathway chaperone